MRYLLLLTVLAPLFAADYVQLTLDDGRTLTGLYDATAGTLALFGGPTVVQVDPKSVTASKAAERPASAVVAAPAATESKPAVASKPDPAVAAKPAVKLPPVVQAAKDKAGAALANVIKEGLGFFALYKAAGKSIPGWQSMCTQPTKAPGGQSNAKVMAAYREAELLGAKYESVQGQMNGEEQRIRNMPFIARIQEFGSKAEAAAGYIR